MSTARYGRRAGALGLDRREESCRTASKTRFETAILYPPAQFEDIIATCRDLDRQYRAATLIQLTLKQA